MTATREPLTPAQTRVYRALRSVYEAKQGQRGATVREVMETCGHLSSSTTHHALLVLERKGYATQGSDSERTLIGNMGSWRPTGYKATRYVPLVPMPH